MMEVALFGAGRIGKIHAGNVARQPGVELRYVVDVDGAAAAALAAAARRAGGVSAEAALADKAVGAVVIGSSTDTHADLITRAARRGQGDLLRKAGRPRGRARAHLRRGRQARRRGVHDRLPAPLRSDVLGAERAPRQGRDRRARDAGRDEPRSRRAAGRVSQALRRHLPRHADPRLRRLPLDPRRRRGNDLRHRQRADRSGGGQRGRRRFAPR